MLNFNLNILMFKLSKDLGMASLRDGPVSSASHRIEGSK